VVDVAVDLDDESLLPPQEVHAVTADRHVDFRLGQACNAANREEVTFQVALGPVRDARFLEWEALLLAARIAGRTSEASAQRARSAMVRAGEVTGIPARDVLRLVTIVRERWI
jgi:hypothetical protein